jgi:hypothetical protein
VAVKTIIGRLVSLFINFTLLLLSGLPYLLIIIPHNLVAVNRKALILMEIVFRERSGAFILTYCGCVAPLSVRVEKSDSLRCPISGAGGLCAQQDGAVQKLCVPLDFCDRPLFERAVR